MYYLQLTLFFPYWDFFPLSPFSPVSGTFPVLLQLPNGQTMPVAIPASITNSSVHIPTTIPVSILLVKLCFTVSELTLQMRCLIILRPSSKSVSESQIHIVKQLLVMSFCVIYKSITAFIEIVNIS